MPRPTRTSSVGVALVEREAVGPGEPRLAPAVAESLFRLMAYKDEYEVARLFTDGRFQERLRRTFEGDPVLRFHMAPPFLGRRRKGDEAPAKITLGPWMLRAMRLLAPLKVLRGTALDPFGRTAERRMERRLIDDYRATIEEMLPRLRPETLDRSVAIAGLAGTIRGYGYIKAAVRRALRAERWMPCWPSSGPRRQRGCRSPPSDAAPRREMVRGLQELRRTTYSLPPSRVRGHGRRARKSCDKNTEALR